MFFMVKHLFILLLAVTMLCSCGASRHEAYVWDMCPDTAFTAASVQEIRLQPYDKISIVVSSRDPKLSALFNLPVVSGDVVGGDTLGGRGLSQYTVDSRGCIDFPVMGRLQVAGLTRDSVARLVKSQLAGRQLLADGVVTVEFCNLGLSVLGEVRHPGRYAITRDCLTILDAIGMAGDLTDKADRRRLVVMRHEDGRRMAYRIDLGSARSIYSSPAYYLRQNDVVYATPK